MDSQKKRLRACRTRHRQFAEPNTESDKKIFGASIDIIPKQGRAQATLRLSSWPTPTRSIPPWIANTARKGMRQ